MKSTVNIQCIPCHNPTKLIDICNAVGLTVIFSSPVLWSFRMNVRLEDRLYRLTEVPDITSVQHSEDIIRGYYAL